MTTITISDPVENLVKELAYKDVDELIKDSVTTEVLCKISNYHEEVRHFEEKYGKHFTEFKVDYESWEEDFDQYDDLMAWEFAQQGRFYWQNRLEGIKNVL